MKKDLTINALLRLQELDFSFDEIIVEFEKVFKEGGLPRILEMILEYIDSLLIKNIPTAVIPKMKKECCSCDTWHTHGHTSKVLKTSIGRLSLRLTRSRCARCKTTYTPFNIFFGFTDKKNYSNELQKKCCELVLNQSYRRSVRELKTIGNIITSKSEVHRIVKNCDLDFQNTKDLKNINTIMADGTGYKPHYEEQKSELKILIGLDHMNHPIPIGAWIFKGWKAIGNELKRNNHPSKKIAFKPIANVLISDGEVAITKNLKELTYHQQRCQWHFVRDFKSAYVYQEKGDKSICRKIQNEMYGQINNCLSSLGKSENHLLESIAKAELHLKSLETQLLKDDYKKTATYVRNAREELFTHLKYVLKTGEEIYRTTSVIERLMRELARRFKRIAHNWSEKGAEKLARMLLCFTLDKKGWEEIWKQKIKVTGNFKLELTQIYHT